jgi:RHS repeat-associated protein
MPGATVTRYLRDGSQWSYSPSATFSTTGDFVPQETDAAVLRAVKPKKPAGYELLENDGTIEIYAFSDGSTVFPRNIFLSEVIDPHGNRLTLHYGKVNGQVRLLSLTDATGRETRFGYGKAFNPLLITRITDPFGRSASLTYNAQGRLSSITDMLGLKTSFTYDATSPTQIDSMTTPYGKFRFVSGVFGDASGPADGLFLDVTDPLGFHERVESFQPAPAGAVPNSDPHPPAGMTNLFNAYLEYRNSFSWDKHQYALGCTPKGGCNYHDMTVTHFTHDASDTSTQWDTVESIKEPLENRIWYTTVGQLDGLGAGASGTYDQPNAIGQVLDSGATQLEQFLYPVDSSGNTTTFGNPTAYVDPVGRTTTLTYASNNIDVTRVAQSAFGGTPQTIAEFTYDAHHNLTSYKDAAGQATLYAYNSAGQLTSVTDALGEKTSYDYDSFGRLLHITNADGKAAASYTYDRFDNIASFTDAGGWTVNYAYDAGDRLTQATYPDGTTEKYVYDRLDLVSYADRQKHVWRYAYDADRRLTSVTDPLGRRTTYSYYEDGTVKTVTDPNGHATSWDIDLEGRTTAEHYADGTETTYTYENSTNRLLSETDPNGQTKFYQYTDDDRLAAITYSGALHPTPNVYFTYDPAFPRLASVTDGTGTATYSYVPVGKPGALQLQEERLPLPNGTISYSYDALGRVVGRSVGGAAPETFKYDKIDRLVGHSDALGSFALSYLGETHQPSLRQLTHSTVGPVSTAWSYLSNRGDRRLASILNGHPGQRQFDYATTAEDLISSITEKKAGSAPHTWSLTYDNDYGLLSAQSSKGAKYGYGFDATGNITSFTAPSGTKAASYNKIDELAALGGIPFSYDADGNLISDGARTYSWDAENRLVGITYAADRKKKTSFAYDALDRRVAITTTTEGRASTLHFIWCGAQLCQSRSNPSAVLREYYDEGEVVPAAKQLFYYGPDQQASVRDVFAHSPVFSHVQSYDYDPFGNPIAAPTTGPTTDFRFAGMYYHADSGLYLTQSGVYDPLIGRWLSRDISDVDTEASPNPYAFAQSDPVNAVGFLCLNGTSCGPEKPWSEWTAPDPIYDPDPPSAAPPSDPPRPPSAQDVWDWAMDWARD